MYVLTNSGWWAALVDPPDIAECQVFLWETSLHTKDVDYLKGLENEHAFELSGVELLDFNFILACVCRSAIGDFNEFFHKLELVICTMQSKGKYTVFLWRLEC